MVDNPIVILSFNRPHLLRLVLQSLCDQQPPAFDRQITMFQDGAKSRFADYNVTESELIEQCVTIFHELIPNGAIRRSDVNLGSPLNYERAERYAFEELDAVACIFLEDDLVLGSGYISVVDCLLVRALADERIGYVAAFGHLQIDLAAQLATPRRLRPLHLLWGFGLTRAHWLNIRPFVKEYLAIVEKTTYETRDVAAIRAMTTRWGVAPGDTGQDRIKAFATALVGATKLNTEVSYAKNIGKSGLTFGKDQFEAWGLDKSEFSETIATLDFDFESVIYDPWYDQNNVWKLGTSPEEIRFIGVARPTRDEVIWLYRCVLGRDPENEIVIERHLTLPSFSAVRESLLVSKEFSEVYQKTVSDTVKKHEVSPSVKEQTSKRKKRILYKSVHEILEYDELRILELAGYEVFTIGAFFGADSSRNLFRQHVGRFNSDKDIAFAQQGGGLLLDSEGSQLVSKNFAKTFDLIIVSQDHKFLLKNMDNFEGVPVVFRTIGMTTVGNEMLLKPFAKRLFVCRYDDNEVDGRFLPTSSVIRFGKFLEEYKPWEGGSRILAFYNSLERRDPRPNAVMFREIVDGAEYRHHGQDSRDGLLSANEQLDVYRKCRLYLYIHSVPASYTLNFMEALAVGAPILAPSYKFTSSLGYPEWWIDRYAIPRMLSDGAGLTYNTIREARSIISSLTMQMCADLSEAARTRASELFDARKIAVEWHNLIEAAT